MRRCYLNLSNTFHTRARTGIQRVVRELGSRLAREHDCELLVIDQGRLFLLDVVEELPLLLEGRVFHPRRQVGIEHFQQGDLLLDLDASWWDAYDCAALWQALKARECRLVKFHHDAVPILFPKLAHPNTIWRFLENFTAAVHHADYWVCTTQTVARDLERIFCEARLGRALSKVCGLGADLPDGTRPRPPASIRLPEDFLLAVGTIEPRKNHDFVLDLFDRLHKESPQAGLALVLVGKSGWNNEAVLTRIENHPALGEQLFWLEAASDDELAWLYQHTRLCLCLSHYEGFGLPAIEALAYGAPVLCTAGSAMEEVARGHALSVPLELDQAVGLVNQVLTGEQALPELSDFRPPRWDEAASALADVLTSLDDRSDFALPLRQAVYISIRPAKLLRSLQSLARHLPFIEQVVVLTADAQHAAIAALAGAVDLPLRVLRESELGLSELPADHAQRNALLRQRLYQHEAVEANFLACDDDCVAVADIERTAFQRGDQHLAYWFFEDGQRWLGALHAPTSFDVSLWKTSAFLAAGAYPTRLYNAHQPQIINKRLAQETFSRTADLGCDEWSSYFNLGKLLRPGAFIDTPYVCAGWPAPREHWLPDVAPTEVLFYNDPVSDGALARQIEQWREGLAQSLARRRLVTPALPQLIVSAEAAQFAPVSIRVPAGSWLQIPILSSVANFSLRYRFAEQEVDWGEYSGNFIMLEVPASAPGSCHHLEAEIRAGEQFWMVQLDLESC